MDLQIPQQDSIKNRYTVVDESDKTILNANNVMLIFNSLINGEYALRPAKTYATHTDFLSETEMVKGQTAYILETGYTDRLYIYDGSQWVGLTGIDYSLKTQEYPITLASNIVTTTLNLETVITYYIFINGQLAELNDEYTIETVNGISTIILAEPNEGKVRIIYQ